MKMKTLILPFLVIGKLCAAQTLDLPLNHFFTIESSVTQLEDSFLYEYWVDSKYLNRDLSHFDVLPCYNAESYNFDSNVNFTLGYGSGIIRFDDLPSSQVEDLTKVYFSFESINAPMQGGLMGKYGQTYYYDTNWVPSCQIPEPQAAALGLIGMMLLINRRKR